MLVHRLFFYFYRSLMFVLFAELTRGVFSAALMMMIKEKINGGVKNALYGPIPTIRRM